MTPGELADHEKVQPPSMTRVIAVLEERNLVLRSPHPTDRRQVILTVTEEGRGVVQRVRRRKDAWLARRLAELTDAERATLRAAVPILEKLSQSSLSRRGAAGLAAAAAAASWPARCTAGARSRRAGCGPGAGGPPSTAGPDSRRALPPAR